MNNASLPSASNPINTAPPATMPYTCVWKPPCAGPGRLPLTGVGSKRVCWGNTMAADHARSRNRWRAPALSLAAPFRVGPREMKAAQTDPLAALSVQVAKALQPDAKEIERARLIAMAFAASKGDLDAFWAARKMRTQPTGAKTSRKK